MTEKSKRLRHLLVALHLPEMRGHGLQASLGMLPPKFAPEPSLEPLTPALSHRAREPVENSASPALTGRPMIVGTKWIGVRPVNEGGTTGDCALVP
jgi:hypothetical protein